MTCCPTRTSAPATTAARSTRTAIRACRSAAASAAAGRGRGRARRRASKAFPAGFDAATRPTSRDLFEGLFGAAGGAARRRRRRPFGGFGRARPPQKGADVAYRLKVPLRRCGDARSSSGSRWRAAGRSTSSCPRGSRTARKIRLAGQGQEGPGGRGDAIVTIEIAPHPFFVRDGNNIRLTCRSRSRRRCSAPRSRCRRPKAPVMLTVPKGSTRARCCASRAAASPARTATAATSWSSSAIDLPAGRRGAASSSPTSWDGGGNPRAALGV